ncbi:unnamed protein product [Cuscuta epithymum]|uniref:Uncharacterized protein n=1 Tax=Cuscuta epithymum TaxID=186058 RepID=A0AAV0D813_9ASTE|nr:unnamed protein product [Cuscuta epithymum]CAH9133597.1 unnamed protein product [Cuscuta epithymum]
MEANGCDDNNLDTDVLLPPRKRLLAGLKKQNCDINLHSPSSSYDMGNNVTGIEFVTRLNKLLRSHLSNNSLSNEEIIEASRVDAAEAAKAARNAKAFAEEKAAKAAKAIMAAKAALELVSNSDEEAASRNSQSKKNKMKKHVAVHTLYNKNKAAGSCMSDEELAKKLHRAINSSSRTRKQHKRLKTLPLCETSKVSSTSIERIIQADRSKMENGEGLQVSKSNFIVVESGKEVANDLKKVDEEYVHNFGSVGKKKGRFKQKKLPLSICNFRDQASPQEKVKSKTSCPIRENVIMATSTATNNKSLFPVERTPTWKCQAFKEPTTCLNQNNPMHS